jgi:hypothetical protein
LKQEELIIQQETHEKPPLNILPKPIHERLKAQQTTIADSFAGSQCFILVDIVFY